MTKNTDAPSTVGEAMIAIVRTVVPLIVGYVLSLAVMAGLHVPEEVVGLVELVLVTVLTAAYYALIRWLSERWAWVGWMLGYPTNPHYEPRSNEVESRGRHAAESLGAEFPSQLDLRDQ